MIIQQLHSSALDKERWDAAVTSDYNARIYSLSWFLDAVTLNNWNGLVYDDYKAVMPFVQGKKLGVRYCYMPYFAQQFSVKEASVYLPLFLKDLRRQYRYGQLSINGTYVALETEERNNYELSLHDHYDLLHSSYSSNHKMNINRFKKGTCEIKRSEDISFLLTLLKEEKSSVFHAKELKGISTNLSNIYHAAAEKGYARLYYACDAEGIIGGAFFVECNHRLYYLLGISKRKSKHNQGISYGLLDHVIQQYAGKPFVLDFEGSQVESISYFFKGFGASNHPYSVVKWNDLPFFIKWIKS